MSLKSVFVSLREKVSGLFSVRKAEEILRSRSGTIIIASVSFAESALPVPLLTDPFLAAAILADRSKVVRLVLITTIASAMGGIFAYFSAAWFFESLSQLVTSGALEEFQNMVDSNESNTFVLTLVGAITPIPYTLVAWVAAVVKGSILAFIFASVLGRGFRYSVVGYCTYKFGPLAVSYAKRYLGLSSVLIFVLVALYIWHKV